MRESPDPHAEYVRPRSLDQVGSARECFRIVRADIGDVLGQVARLDLSKRLIVTALDVGDRGAGDYECRDQHGHDNHGAQQRCFCVELKCSHRAA